MALAYDNATIVTLNASGANTTSFTVTGSGNTLMVAGLYDTVNITAMTYNGVSMTQDVSHTRYWYLLNAPAGANTLSITRSGVSPGGMQIVISISGASTTTPPIYNSTLTGSGTTISDSATNTVSNSMLLDFYSMDMSTTNTNPNPTATGTGHTRRANMYESGADRTATGVGTTPTTTVTSYSIGYTLASSTDGCTGDFYEIVPPAGAGTMTNITSISNVQTIKF